MYITHIPVPRHRPAAHRLAGRTHTGLVGGHAGVGRAHPQRQVARHCGGHATAHLRHCPMCPPVAEMGYKDFETSQWYGILAPAGTPPDVVESLAGGVVQGAALQCRHRALRHRRARVRRRRPGDRVCRPSSRASSAIWSDIVKRARHQGRTKSCAPQAQQLRWRVPWGQRRLTRALAPRTGIDVTDVLVIGGGNAALSAALMAREAGASVWLLEAAPRAWRGGNSIHTRNLRCMHDAPQDVLVDAYPEEEFWQDLLKVTGGLTDEALARLVIRASATCRPWMRRARRALSALAVGRLAHCARQCLFHGRRQGAGQCLLPQRRRRSACRSSLQRPGRAPNCELQGRIRGRSALASGDRAHHGQGLCAGRAVASNPTAIGCARPGARTHCGEWPADNFLIRGTRYNQGVVCSSIAGPGRRRDRRPHSGAHGRPSMRARRCTTVALCDPAWIACRWAWWSTTRRRTLLRRGRRLLAQALRHLGPPGGAAAGADRLLHHRCQGRRPFHAAGVRGIQADTLPELARQARAGRGHLSCRP